MIQPSKVTGALIMGGQARRFGGNKALAVWNGTPMYASSYAVLKEIAETVTIVGQKQITDELLIRPGDLLLEDSDHFSGMGPLAGLYTAMANGATDWYAVMPCDTPLINKDVFLSLFETISKSIKEGTRPDAVIPLVEKRKQPLIGVYHSSVLPVIQELLETRRLKMAFLLDNINTYYVDQMVHGIGSDRFMNINTQREFQQLKAKYGIE